MNQKKFAYKHYLLMILGTAILSFGLFNVHSQSRITEGGVLGLTLLLKHWFHISPSVSGILMDCTCYLLGAAMLGKTFLKNALTASISFSLWYHLWEDMGYLLPDWSEHSLIAAIVGGLFVGVGVGIVVREGGASGGDDALAMVISKVTHCRIARAYLATDLMVLALSLTYLPIKNIFFCLITVTLSSFVIDKIQDIGVQSPQNRQEDQKEQEIVHTQQISQTPEEQKPLELVQEGAEV